MKSMEPLPVIRHIDTDRDDLCALDVVGRLTAADLENAFGLLQAAFEQHDRIDLLVRICDCEGFDWSEALDKTVIKARLQALRHVRKYALVGGPAWVRLALGLSRPFLSLDARYFPLKDEESAWKWLNSEL